MIAAFKVHWCVCSCWSGAMVLASVSTLSSPAEFHQIIKELNATPNLFVLFLGSPVPNTSQSWCPGEQNCSTWKNYICSVATSVNFTFV
jgi:hypothetical protein